jgi:hypothetical protein
MCFKVNASLAQGRSCGIMVRVCGNSKNRFPLNIPGNSPNHNHSFFFSSA